MESEAEYEEATGVPLTIADKLWNRSHLWRVTEVAASLRKPDERPFNGPVYCQDEWWVDRHGHAHRVEEMSLHYVRSVINFLERRAVAIHRRMNRALLIAVLRFFDQFERPSGFVDVQTGRHLSWHEVWGERMQEEWVNEIENMYGDLDLPALDWLRETPLMRALYARLDSP